MKILKASVATIFLLFVVFALNHKWASIPAIGPFINPQNGFIANQNLHSLKSFARLHFSNLEDSVKVYFDDRMVPHIFAQNDEDAYFMLGYLHAKDRLWQMEFQTHLAGGRLTEIVGKKALNLDRSHRRMGMVWAAENALKEIEKDILSKKVLDAYTQGANEYITNVSQADLPIEYKLLGYKPELWTNLKTALFLKFMCKDLAGYDEDFERTNVLAACGRDVYNWMYPILEDSLKPIIPTNNLILPTPTFDLNPLNPSNPYFNPISNNTSPQNKPEKGNGSNNWAISGTKTHSGRPILCDDPHLRLRLPAIWYEAQISTPTYNSYGVTLPGAPVIVIGFNDSISFGVTNAMRDVLDYYQIHFTDQTKKYYEYNGKLMPSSIKIETYNIKGEKPFIDTVYYTHFGPIIYDESFHGGKDQDSQISKSNRSYAIRWKAHDPSNELIALLMADRAQNFQQFKKAISNFKCPGQNFVFAAKNGDIAMIQQGEFPAKWKYQGEFIMDGIDSTFDWKYMIQEPIFEKNPSSGYVMSANQLPADPTVYPYFLGGDYIFERGHRINHILKSIQKAGVKEMMNMQNDNFNVRASMFLPFIIPVIEKTGLSQKHADLITVLKSWDFINDKNAVGATYFSIFYEELEKNIWSDELAKSYPASNPEEYSLIQALMKDINFPCVDNIQTKQKENINQILSQTCDSTASKINQLKLVQKIKWGLYKDSGIYHLLDLDGSMDAFSSLHLNIGGGDGIVNATKVSHGPSWRMVVHMTDEIEAYGVYPGGQSGHIGNQFYNNGVEKWSSGTYFKLWMMKEKDKNDSKILSKWIVTK